MNIKDMIPDYLTWLKAMDRSPHTIRDAGYTLRNFVIHLAKENVHHIEDLTRTVIEDYQQELAFSLTAKGRPLTVRTQIKRLGVIKGLTRYLNDHDYMVHDPSSKIKLPKEPRRLPRSILTPSEVKKLMNTPDIRTDSGYRDLIILEILYDTAVRRSELAGIKVHDVDLDGGYILVCGKGDKERVVPLSARVCELIKNYILAIRPDYIKEKDTGWLFMNDKGQQIHVHTVWMIVKKNAKKAHLNKNITTHTFRHTCVTHMLKNGAPIRHLQEMLGHESLESTQIYTRVTINDLKDIHAKYHPGDSLKP